MHIKNDEITVIIQGPIIENETSHSISSVKSFLPKAKIILSTWENSKIDNIDIDALILNTDPGSVPCAVLPDKKKILYNLNRQLVSTQSALKKVETKYVLKIRSDLYFTKDFQKSFLSYFDVFKSRNEEYAFFKHRVIVSSLTSKKYSDSPDNSIPLPFHISDWFFFGLTEDIKDYFLNTKLLDERKATNYACDINKIPVKMYHWKIPPEQYFCSEWVKRHIDLEFDTWCDWNADNISLSEKIIANNFIVLDTIQHGLYSNKYLELINNNNGEIYTFQGYISHLSFVELYKKYCQNNYKIDFTLYYSRNSRHNELIKKYKKYNNTNNKLNLLKVLKKAIIKFKLFLLEQKILHNLRKQTLE